MSTPTHKDIRTLAYVLRRTNVGEADRILNIITPTGKMSVVAKGVRKEKSKLAGGVEIFSLTELNIHFGSNKMGVLTGSKMLKFYSNILADLNRMELASLILRKVSTATESSDNPDFFKITDACLSALDDGVSNELVECWFWFNYRQALGEQINLYRDANGEKLQPDKTYYWDVQEVCLAENQQGDIGANEIKIMRMMMTTDLEVVRRIKDVEKSLFPILRIAKAVNRI